MQFTYASPIGEILISYDDSHITGLYFDKKATEAHVPNAIIDLCTRQLDQYFAGTLTRFDVPMRTAGTPFQAAVWAELAEIPYGAIVSYGHIAARIGKPKAARAVGGANNKNPISIIVPCHRVVGANGKMVGYGGEVWRKEWLLTHEMHVDERLNSTFDFLKPFYNKAD